MGSFDFDISEVMRKTDRIVTQAVSNAKDTMQDCVDDLVRISSQIAPIDTGRLRQSWDKKVKQLVGSVVGEVSYSAVESSPGYGRFNYALWTHEYMDNSQVRRPGSYDGYMVGNKYLQRPLYGESEKYLMWLAEAVEKGVGNA